MKDRFGRDQLPQVWDELRRKVGAAQEALPTGAGPSIVDDDFGDVYGIYVGISGEGYAHRELKEYVDLLRRELLLVPDVKGIALWGVQPQAVFVEIDRERLSTLGIPEERIFAKLRARGVAVAAGHAQVGSSWVPLAPSGDIDSVDQIGNLLISDPGAPVVPLRDVARIERREMDPPQTLLRMSYKRDAGGGASHIESAPAIGLAISTAAGGNVVRMGEALADRMRELEAERPIGIELTVIAMQADAVKKAVDSFVVNLVEAIAIVVVVLLFFMGLRAGLLIGFVLFVTIAATLIVMDAWGIMLERISLGALIIALGMLVDNAIVVTEGMQLRLERGDDPLDTAREVVGQNQWPLLGATFVAVLAFAPIGLSQDDTGEFCRSLFQVLLTSLSLSWLTAVTITPLLCAMLFHPKDGAQGERSERDPYAGTLFRVYRSALDGAIRARFVTIGAVVALFALSIAGFGRLPDGFFPSSARPQYMVDLWMPQGNFVRDTERAAAALSSEILARENTHAVASHVGAGGTRFLLVYSPELPNPAYAQLIVNVEDPTRIDDDIQAIEGWAREHLPNALVYGKRFNIGPGKGGNVQLRLAGPDPVLLRALADEAQQRIAAHPHAKYVRSDWKEPVKVVRPMIDPVRATRAGIERPAVASRLATAFEGRIVGSLREATASDEDRVLPIIARAPRAERRRIDSLSDLSVWSPAADRMIPLREIVTGFETDFEDDQIFRRNRKPTITLHVDQTEGPTAELWASLDAELRPWFEAKRASGDIDGRYTLAWGGEHEDSANAIGALAGNIPLFLALMVFVVIALFNNLRQPLAIWLTVPLALIGVTTGLLLFDKPFGFMALLGTLALSGMLIKNSIVLIDEMNANEARGLKPYDAIVDAGVSRLRPVMMAAATTVLGMLPLLQDPFFVGMSVAVMFGLTFATGLTLIFVPVLSATLRGVAAPPLARS